MLGIENYEAIIERFKNNTALRSYNADCILGRSCRRLIAGWRKMRGIE